MDKHVFIVTGRWIHPTGESNVPQSINLAAHIPGLLAPTTAEDKTCPKGQTKPHLRKVHSSIPCSEPLLHGGGCLDADGGPIRGQLPI